MIFQLKNLRNAPVADAYSGPAILSCSAASVFFHEIFGHRIEGQRMKSDFDSQTFKSKMNDYVLPKFVSVVSDPTLSKFAGQDMFGYYKYDDQGVAAQKVIVVNNGILQNFLMSRSPIEGFPNSNGHGRAKAGMAPVSRQSNLIVETKKPLTDKELRKKLINECKKENKEYGYLFDQVVGGFTMTSRYSPNVFNVSPTIVYKIFVDGRADELVRGVNFIGTPLAIFSEIEGTGDSTGVFTGYCGAESGSIPVTATSPALFIKKIETQKQPEGYGQMPILPRPDVEKFNKQ
jgi:TldD protein